MRWKSNILIVVSVVVGVVALGAATVPMTNQPEFCAGCHTIAPSYESWVTSSHKDVTCVACHVRPGIEGWLQDKVLAGVRDSVLYVFGNPADAHNLKAVVDSGRCLSCHRSILRVSEVASRDLPPPVNDVGLIMSHGKHMEAFKERGQGEGCTTCHAGVVHDRPIKGYATVIPRGHVAADDKPWYPDHPEGSALHERALADCFRCHDGKTEYRGKLLDRKCDTCHIADKIADLF